MTPLRLRKTMFTELQDSKVLSSAAFSQLSTVGRYFSLTLMIASAN